MVRALAAAGGGDLAGVTDVAGQGVAQRGGVLVVEVDLVGGAVEPEGHGLRGVTAVDVVDQDDVHLLRHCCFPLPECHPLANSQFSMPERRGTGKSNGRETRNYRLRRKGQLEPPQRERGHVVGEAAALVDAPAGRDSRWRSRVTSSSAPIRRSCARRGPRPGRRPRTRIPDCNASTVLRAMTDARPRQFDLAQLRAAVSEGLEGELDPGAIAPPTYWPAASTTSKVVAVPPKSTTTAGPPKSVAAARALTIRSVPTSRGLSVRTGTPVRTPGSTTRRGRSPKWRASMSRHSCSTAGTVAHTAMPVDLGDPVAQQAAQQHRPLVGGAVADRRHPPLGEHVPAVETTPRTVWLLPMSAARMAARVRQVTAPRGPGRGRRP